MSHFEVSDDLFCEILGRFVISDQCRHLTAMLHWSSFKLYRESSKNMVFQGNMLEQSGGTFRVRVDNLRCYKNILLHVPHSSSSFPEKKSNHSYNDLDNEERLLVDYYTDELFVSHAETEHISSVVFPYCRLYCDVERLINDPLEKEGLGIRYLREVKTGSGYPYRSFSSKK